MLGLTVGYLPALRPVVIDDVEVVVVDVKVHVLRVFLVSMQFEYHCVVCHSYCQFVLPCDCYFVPCNCLATMSQYITIIHIYYVYTCVCIIYIYICIQLIRQRVCLYLYKCNSCVTYTLTYNYDMYIYIYYNYIYLLLIWILYISLIIIYPYFIRTAPHGGVIFALKMVKHTGIYSVLWPK